MLNSDQRVRQIESRYKRKTLDSHTVYMIIDRAVRLHKPISVIRLGDVMAKLLSRQNVKSLRDISEFLGVPLPPPQDLQSDLEKSVRVADIVGLSHYDTSIKHLKKYMKRSGWKPRFICDSFINDQLYKNGYLHLLMRSHRVALVGRAAPTAAARLRKQGINVAMTLTLDHYYEINTVLNKLKRHKEKFDLVLVGASVPGRILCARIKLELGRSAVEIGHMMDALSHPNAWRKKGDVRKKFKLRWIRKLQAKNAP